MNKTDSEGVPENIDGVFIGGGHNSMVCAAYLAKAGQRVLVLEASPQVGGGTTTDEVTLLVGHDNVVLVGCQSFSKAGRDRDRARRSGHRLSTPGQR